jgi:hypothetical protein
MRARARRPVDQGTRTQEHRPVAVGAAEGMRPAHVRPGHWRHQIDARAVRRGSDRPVPPVPLRHRHRDVRGGRARTVLRRERMHQRRVRRHGRPRGVCVFPLREDLQRRPPRHARLVRPLDRRMHARPGRVPQHGPVPDQRGGPGGRVRRDITELYGRRQVHGGCVRPDRSHVRPLEPDIVLGRRQMHR